MSSFINFYLVPKSNPQEHLTFLCYGSDTVIYEFLYPEVSYAYNDKTKDANYTELSYGFLNRVIDDIDSTIQANNERIGVYYNLKLEDSVDNICSLQKRNKELQDTLNILTTLLNMIDCMEFGCSKFIRMEVNYD